MTLKVHLLKKNIYIYTHLIVFVSNSTISLEEHGVFVSFCCLVVFCVLFCFHPSNGIEHIPKKWGYWARFLELGTMVWSNQTDFSLSEFLLLFCCCFLWYLSPLSVEIILYALEVYMYLNVLLICILEKNLEIKKT